MRLVGLTVRAVATGAFLGVLVGGIPVVLLVLLVEHVSGYWLVDWLLANPNWVLLWAYGATVAVGLCMWDRMAEGRGRL